MIDTQQGDIKLFQTDDDGEIDLTDVGLITMTPRLETLVYLCLFGGNEDDEGGDDTALSWWGNIGELPERQLRSVTQNLLLSLPATTGNLIRIEDAMRQDLQVLLDTKLAKTVEVSARLVGPNRVKLSVVIVSEVSEEFVFIQAFNPEVKRPVVVLPPPPPSREITANLTEEGDTTSVTAAVSVFDVVVTAVDEAHFNGLGDFVPGQGFELDNIIEIRPITNPDFNAPSPQNWAKDLIPEIIEITVNNTSAGSGLADVRIREGGSGTVHYFADDVPIPAGISTFEISTSGSNRELQIGAVALNWIFLSSFGNDVAYITQIKVSGNIAPA